MEIDDEREFAEALQALGGPEVLGDDTITDMASIPFRSPSQGRYSDGLTEYSTPLDDIERRVGSGTLAAAILQSADWKTILGSLYSSILDGRRECERYSSFSEGISVADQR